MIEREYLTENLSMLVASGMGIAPALDAIKSEMSSRRMQKVLEKIKRDVESGYPIWRALDASKMFPRRAVSLIRIGEETGKLSQNLKLLAIQEQKEKTFRSKIRSAMVYPLFVLLVTSVVGIGTAWFILPRLTTVFSQLKLDLPLPTRMLIATGGFFQEYGIVAVPVFVFVLAGLLYVLFFFSQTKWLGQAVLFRLPGVSKLIQEVELSRFGYLLGTLLGAGISVVSSLDSLKEVTSFRRYNRGSNKMIPVPIQQMIIAGEQSGNLSETLLKIGEIFESKTETSTKNLTVILEPILLVIVWLGVVGVALAIILPIYNLIGGLNG
jgi:type IV pilus assembly protein PilC